MRNLCWWAVPCSAAIFLAVYLLPEGLLLPVGAFCAVCGFGSLFFHGRTRRKIALVSAGLAVGLLWTGCYGLLLRAPARALAEQEPGEYTLEVAGFPRETGWGAFLDAKLLMDGMIAPMVRLYANADALELRPGDVLSAVVKLSPSDQRRGETVDYYEAGGIYLLGSVRGEITSVHRPGHVPFWYWPQLTAKAVKDSISRIFPADVAGFLTALTTGDKSQLPAGLYAAFRRSGIAHVMAVSGLHIGFLAAAIALLLGRRNGLGPVLITALIFFFASATGNSPSALRASFMTVAILLAPLVGREDDKPTTLAAVLAILLLACPYSAASASLQLSFAAVAGIYLISGPLCQRWLTAIPKWKGFPGKLGRTVLSWAAVSIAATLGALLFSTPIAALYYRSVSLAGLLTNLLTLWVISLVFMGGLLAALVGLACAPAGSALAWTIAWPARWIMWVARGISRWPFASVSLLSGYLTGWFVIAYSIVLVWLFARRSMRPAIPIAAVIVTLCAALLTSAWPAVTGALTVAVLDVGQGASNLLWSKGHAVLVDCGGNRWDDAGDIAADYLQALGTSRLDALILTHYHADHAGGVPELLSRLDVRLLILPDVTPEEPLRAEILSLAEKYGCEVELLFVDAHVAFGDASLEIYAPLGSGGTNEEGLSVLCTAGDFDVLITGDMNDVTERRLVKYKFLPDIELLVVGHHGSKTSASEELLLTTTPEAAVISSGYNTFGHPAPEALERLGAAGCDIYRTDQMGTVTFTVTAD